jgi:PAS domain S-box-containing protein
MADVGGHLQVIAIGDRAACAVRSATSGLEEGLELRATQSWNDSLLVQGGDSHAPDLIVIGPDVDDAAKNGQRLMQRWRGTQLLFLVEADELLQFRTRLPFIPHLGSSWTASAEAQPDELRRLVIHAGRSARQQLAMHAMMRRVNEQLALGASAREQERRDQRRRLSHEYFTTLLDIAPDGFFALDVRGVVLASNRSARQILNLEEEQNDVSLLDLVAESARKDLSDALRDAAHAKAAGVHELPLPSGADGRLRWVEISLSPVSEGRESAVIAANIRDTTRRKVEEQRQRAIAELSDRSRELVDPADLAYAAAEILGRTLAVSRVGYGTVDVQAETITIERDWNAPGIMSLAGVLKFRDYGSYIDDLKRGETVVFADAEKDPRTSDRAEALKAISAQSVVNMPITEEGGMVALLYLNHAEARDWSEDELVFVRDIAERTRVAVERRRAEQELQKLAASLEAQVAERTADLMRAEAALRQAQKMEAVGQLTGGIAHDFNNLLTIILGNLDAAKRHLGDNAEARITRAIGNALVGANRAATLTQRLLAFSRRQPLAPKPTNANRLVSGMSDLLHRTLGETIELETVLSPRLWQTEIDPHQLENAILNLAVNARDAMPEGGKLTIETANTHLDRNYIAENAEVTPGQYVAICISDTGSGMDAETAAKAFEPFFTTKEVGKGTGLGLSMVYGFVKQSGGHLKIYSEPGHGTTIKIYLPRLQGHLSVEEANSVPIVPRGTNEETILVCEDDDDVRAYTVEMLRELGYRVLEAHDGSSALRLLERQEGVVDLLFTDVVLPGGMTGAVVAREARAIRPELKVLFTTGYARDAIMHHGRLEAGVELLTKPFTYSDLAARVRDVLDAKR